MEAKDYVESEKTAIGELRVWHIPQVPMKPFHVKVENIKEARQVINLLADYDSFQLKNKIKGDYANVSGLEIFVEDAGEGIPGWNEWETKDGATIHQLDDDGNKVWD